MNANVNCNFYCNAVKLRRVYFCVRFTSKWNRTIHWEKFRNRFTLIFFFFLVYFSSRYGCTHWVFVLCDLWDFSKTTNWLIKCDWERFVWPCFTLWWFFDKTILHLKEKKTSWDKKKHIRMIANHSFCEFFSISSSSFASLRIRCFFFSGTRTIFTNLQDIDRRKTI